MAAVVIAEKKYITKHTMNPLFEGNAARLPSLVFPFKIKIGVTHNRDAEELEIGMVRLRAQGKTEDRGLTMRCTNLAKEDTSIQEE